MHCQEMNNGNTITSIFQGEDSSNIHRLFLCLEPLYFDYCKNTALNRVFTTRYEIRHRAGELCELAFNDALVCFYFKIRQQGFKEGNAAVQTYFYDIFYFKLLSQIKKFYRYRDNPGKDLFDLN